MPTQRQQATTSGDLPVCASRERRRDALLAGIRQGRETAKFA
jgi:hypothetical protein